MGTEFLGLSGTLGDILNLMNITELGIGTAVGVTLYKPLFDDKRETINDIISVYGYLYSKVGKIIGGLGIGVSIFFPIIFEKADISLFIVYFMFYAMLYSSLLGYFINYRQIILSASQQNYVVSWRYNIAMMIKVILQIGASYLPYNYIWWILLEVLTVSTYSIILNRTINKYYPWLQTSIQLGKDKFKEYKHLWVKTKQVFVLKVSHLLFNGSINIFIGVFASLSSVALYGNYNMLMFKITGFVDSIFTGMEASVGNLIAEGDIKKILKVFFELLSIRYFLATFCSVALFFIVPRFVEVWLGNEYILPTLVLSLMSVHIFIQQARLTVDNFKGGYGLYQDVWAPITEVIVCVIFASVLGYLFKLPGILIGYVLGESFIKMIWKPYYLFKMGFKCSVLRLYWPKILRYGLILAIVLFGLSCLNNNLGQFLTQETWLSVIIYCLMIGFITLFSLFILYWIFDYSFRGFVKHLIAYKTMK
ncbi:MAG: sugar transporter [Muribaculum sp.]|nr:sugar transporter [Muribaculum sp.]